MTRDMKLFSHIVNMWLYRNTDSLYMYMDAEIPYHILIISLYILLDSSHLKFQLEVLQCVLQIATDSRQRLGLTPSQPQAIRGSSLRHLSLLANYKS